MRVFVLGAGASSHAGYPFAATLGEDLALWAERDDVEGFRYRDQLRELKAEFGGNFEHILTVLREEKESGKRSAIPDLGSAISFFFNSIRNRPAELYDHFASAHVSSGDVVITFNYDLAVERSLKAAEMWDVNDGYGKALAQGSRETPPSKVSILKLHGSTNWWGSLFNGVTGYSATQSSVGNRPLLFFEPDFHFLGYENLRDPKAPVASGLISAIISPTLKKEFFLKTTFGNEWEPFWNSLWREADQAVHQADEIVIIGYSLIPADERARNLLRRSNRNALVTVCCHAQSERIASEFRSWRFTDAQVPSTPTFEGWLEADPNTVHSADVATWSSRLN